MKTWAGAKARIALCRPDRVSLCPWKSAQPFTKQSLCLMCLPLDGNICFFLSMETEADREKERRSGENVGAEGRKPVILGEASVFKAWLSPYWANTVSVCSWYGLCGGKAGHNSVEFAVHVVPFNINGCNLLKACTFYITYIQIYLHTLQSSREQEQTSISSYSAARIKHLPGNKKSHAQTKQSEAESGTPISPKHSHRLHR